jgi:hypothetical protein
MTLSLRFEGCSCASDYRQRTAGIRIAIDERAMERPGERGRMIAPSGLLIAA